MNQHIGIKGQHQANHPVYTRPLISANLNDLRVQQPRHVLLADGMLIEQILLQQYA